MNYKFDRRDIVSFVICGAVSIWYAVQKVNINAYEWYWSLHQGHQLISAVNWIYSDRSVGQMKNQTYNFCDLLYILFW